jgi:hypothetical protein
VVHTRYWSRIVFDRRTILTFEEVDLTFLNKNIRKLNASVGMKIARIRGRSATTGYKTMGIRELDMYVSSFFFPEVVPRGLAGAWFSSSFLGSRFSYHNESSLSLQSVKACIQRKDFVYAYSCSPTQIHFSLY